MESKRHDIKISIHAPVKGATLLKPLLEEAGFISIHAPVKGATHPLIDDYIELAISIHAPVKGATGIIEKFKNRKIISIHAPVKGATHHPADGQLYVQYFNPRPREGSDFPSRT